MHPVRIASIAVLEAVSVLAVDLHPIAAAVDWHPIAAAVDWHPVAAVVDVTSIVAADALEAVAPIAVRPIDPVAIFALLVTE